MFLARWAQGMFPIHDPAAIVRFRQAADSFANALMRPPRGVMVEPASIGGVRGDWLVPADAPDDPVILFLHGGGIAFGWNNPMRREVAWLARFAGLRAFGVDYSLIPGHVYPAAHDECWSVYQALLKAGKQVVLVGESSGGVLALALLLWAKKAGLPQPLLCALISPVVDFGFKEPRIWQTDDPFAHPKFVVELHKHYLAGNDPSLPDLSPVCADLSGTAPLYILAGENEIMRVEVERLEQAAKRYNVPVDLLLWPDAWHSWHALIPQLPEAVQALRAFGAGIHQRVSASMPPGDERWKRGCSPNFDTISRMKDDSYSRFQNHTLILRDELALDRTRLANERTLLAYLRSAVALLIAGVSIMQFSQQAWFWSIGIACLPIGVVTGVIGVVRYRRMNKAINLVRNKDIPCPEAEGSETPSSPEKVE